MGSVFHESLRENGGDNEKEGRDRQKIIAWGSGKSRSVGVMLVSLDYQGDERPKVWGKADRGEIVGVM